MTIRPASTPPACVGMLATLLLPLWAITASAQVPAPATPVAAVPASVPLPFRSALEDYQPYSDEKTLPWKEANDNVGRIGGWRAYAKEAAQPQTPDASAKPDPHAGHAKP